VEDVHHQSQSQITKIESARDLGVIVIDEEYLDWYIKSQLKKEQEKPPQVEMTASQDPKSKKPPIERIITRKIFKGEPHYLVAYSGLPETSNELLPREVVKRRYGEDNVETYDKYYEKKIRKRILY